LLLGYLASMEKEMTLAAGDADEQDPTVMLWLLYFISYHYLWVRDYQTALEYVNRAIEHTPTLLELYTLKGKIYQKAGDIHTAAKLFEEARQMDTADRAINAISALYQVKSGKIEEGEEIMSIFFKDCGYESTVHDN
jgi:N-alpha-acetyltransferase 15/16, NatA auxiliary subunit